MNSRAIPTKIAAILKSTRLAALLERARGRARLEAAVAACLPPELRGHCRLGGIDGGRVLLEADSAAWATRVRYAAPTLLEALRALPEGRALIRLEVRVTTPTVKRSAPPVRRPSRPLTKEGAQALGELARSEPDPKLRAALLRLSRRSRG